MAKIGLETHLALNKLNSKLFCRCSIPNPDSQPNTHTCEVCLGMPGSKPVLNKAALNMAIKLALALNCKIEKEIRFSRKSYFYPDLPKNFQITQYEIPLAKDGYITLNSGKKINIKRVHLEEDPGALIHPAGMQESNFVLVDYNRCGVALIEIVTEPDLETAEEAREYLKKLISIVNYLKIHDPMISTVKADVNISIKESGYTRTEIKNISGFKEVERALIYEINRHKEAINRAEHLIQETRAWDVDGKTTFSLRKKEAEEDYGYILEPDLSPIEISDHLIKSIKKELPELSQEKIKRFIKEYGLAKTDAEVLASELLLAELFEKVAHEIDPILAAKWLRRELMRVLHYNEKEIHEIEIDETHIIELLYLIEKETITDTTAKKILEELIISPFSPKEYVKTHKLEAKASIDELKIICEKAIKESPKAIEDYKKGEEKALNFIVGKVMKETKGQAKPDVINKILKEILKD